MFSHFGFLLRHEVLNRYLNSLFDVWSANVITDFSYTDIGHFLFGLVAFTEGIELGQCETPELGLGEMKIIYSEGIDF